MARAGASGRSRRQRDQVAQLPPLASEGLRYNVQCEGKTSDKGDIDMRFLALFVTSVLLTGSALGASLGTTDIRGDYMEARTADVYTGPCFANAEVGLEGQLAVMGWKIQKGAFEGVDLSGLGVVGVVKASATLGDVHHSAYPVKAVLIVDERANPEQRIALKGFAQKMGGDLLQDVVKIEYAPIEMAFENGNLHSVKGTLQAGSLAKIQTRALAEGDHICTNEEVWYLPLTKVDHAMPAYTLAHSFQGDGLKMVWSNPYKRSAFVGTFHLQE
jgi:hypothetical protein